MSRKEFADAILNVATLKNSAAHAVLPERRKQTRTLLGDYTLKSSPAGSPDASTVLQQDCQLDQVNWS